MPYPAGTVTNAAGHLEIGGCDVVELAERFGTPAYLFSVAEMRDRARAYQKAFAAHTDHFEVLFASKALPVTAAYRLFAEEGLSVDVASGGELTMALTAGFDPMKIYMHGNNKTDAELRLAGDYGVGHLIVDSFDEIERCERVLRNSQDVLIRVTPGIKPSTHSFIQTGQLDSKFGFGLEDGTAAKAIDRVLASDRLNLVGLHFHIGSQIFEIEPFRLAVEALGELRGDWCEILDLGGGLGISYAEQDSPPAIEEYVNLKVQAVRDVFGDQTKILIEPGRSLVGTAGVTIYRIGTVKEIPGVRTYVAVDGGMSDNLRPMLYDAQYTAVIPSRPDDPADTLVTVAGSHCESGDILIQDVELASPRVGDILLTPATGAYGHSMANNYNGMPRPPVIFCEDGEAKVVVRRETWDDLMKRDM
ncbi:MAG: diaminopimelate decarboxylase [Actinomycetota bacterium]|jgi:diaminopimelate decarboxylase|nr:diaminopimelate decarboxylase [Actinomycetota bacterium]